MGEPRYATCKGCGKSRDEVGVLSWTRLCTACSHERLLGNIAQMQAREGPNFDRWRVGLILAAGVGGIDVLAALRHSAADDAGRDPGERA